MNGYINMERRPELERPVLIAGFTGWNDAAEAASLAVSAVGEQWGAKRFGGFDGEEFYDYQTTRPQIKLVEGVTRTIEWPENELSATEAHVGALDGSGAILLSGPVSVAANAQDPSLVDNLGLTASRYEGPTGITGVLHRYCASKNLPSVSFWASVPHYLPSVPSAPAALALMQSLSNLLGTSFDTAHLESSSEDYQRQVSVAVAQDSDLASYVRTLEERYDAQTESGERNLPSGDELAKELERFLREKGEDE